MVTKTVSVIVFWQASSADGVYSGTGRSVIVVVPVVVLVRVLTPAVLLML